MKDSLISHDSARDSAWNAKQDYFFKKKERHLFIDHVISYINEREQEDKDYQELLKQQEENTRKLDYLESLQKPQSPDVAGTIVTCSRCGQHLSQKVKPRYCYHCDQKLA